VRAATPTHAAEMLVPDRDAIVRSVRQQASSAGQLLLQAVEHYQVRLRGELFGITERLDERMARTQALLASTRSVLAELNPATVLERGYAILRGNAVIGQTIEIETLTKQIEAEVRHVRQR